MKNYQELLEKINKLKEENKLDLSSDEDLSLGVMNLISIEEHLFYTYKKTNQEKYLDYLNQIREIRKELMKKLIRNKEGEFWCITKHLLAASMRLMEVGTKYLNRNEKEKARDFFEKSFNLYAIFWALNLDEKNDLIGELLEEASEDQDNIRIDSQKISPFAKFKEILKKILDCCRE
jgi:tetratricopeptide (TPR) repeat protein